MDINCPWDAENELFDLDPSFTEISGVDELSQRVARRLVTPQGQLPWAPDVGIDLIRGLTNAKVTSAQINMIRSRVRNEAEREEGIDSADVDISFSGGSLQIVIKCETNDGPFRLTFAPDDKEGLALIDIEVNE